MENMGSIIKKHNKKILSNTPAISDDGCNCRSKDQCPIENKCLSSALVYNATVTTNDSNPGKNYIGLTEGTFKNVFMDTSCLSKIENMLKVPNFRNTCGN